LEAKLAEALALNTSLQSEIDKAKSMHDDTERDLRGQLDSMASRNSQDDELKDQLDSLQQENQELQQDNQELQQELLEQQRVTDEVRREAAGFLQEMKALSVQSDESYEREEKLMRQVRMLEDQVVEWKDRFARSKAQTRAASLALVVQQPNMETDGFLQPNGLISDVHVIEFQLAIDEALRVSRADPKSLLSQMKSVILAVKHITEDFEVVDVADPTVSKLITKISGTACNYITATKNFVYSSGLSPVSLVDAAASHLSSAVIDAVHTVKMHPSDEDDEDIVPDIIEKSGKYYSTNGRSSVSESVYSSTTAPRASQYTTRQSISRQTVNGISNGMSNGNGNYAPSNGFNPIVEKQDLKELKVCYLPLSNSHGTDLFLLGFSL
jgi:hypothetical protein